MIVESLKGDQVFVFPVKNTKNWWRYHYININNYEQIFFRKSIYASYFFTQQQLSKMEKIK